MACRVDNKVTVQSDAEGKIYTVIDSTGLLHKGTVVIKDIYCGKKCKGCPHGKYKYIVWRQDTKTKWKYIGKVNKEAQCQAEQKTQ